MRVLSKIVQACGLVVLLLLGWAGVLAAYISYMSDKVPVFPMGDGRVSVFAWDDGFVTAIGTWTIDVHGHAFPLNVSEISCIRDEGRCLSASGRVRDRYLTAELERYRIQKWDASTLEFVTETPCVTYLYVVNRGTEKLTGRRLRKNAPAEQCPDFLEADLRLSFIDGWRVKQDLEAQHAPIAVSLFGVAAWFVFILAWMVRIMRR